VSRIVNAGTASEAVALEQGRGSSSVTLITHCISHASANVALGGQSVLADASDTTPQIRARIVAEMVRFRKVHRC
jgi:hypothetical protein